MGLKGKVTSLDDVAEQYRSLYAKDGDSFVLTEYEPEDTTGLKSALSKEKQEARRLKELTKAFEGIDPEVARELLEKSKKADEDALKQQGKWDEMKQQVIDEWQKKLEPLEKDKERYKVAVEKYLIDAQATNAIVENKGKPLFLLPHVKQHIRVVEENGEFVARVVDASGNLRIGDAQGNPMTIAQLIERDFKAKEEFGAAFEPSGAAGSGAPANHVAGGLNGKRTVKRADFDKMDPADQMAAVKAGSAFVD